MIAGGRKPSFMTLTCLMAGLCTVAVGWATDTVATEGGKSQRVAEELDRQDRAFLHALGWRPLASSAALTASHGVEILQATEGFLLELPNGPVRGDPGTDQALLQAAAAVVTAELTRYPAELLRRSGLRRVVLCVQLREQDQPIPSLPNYKHTLLLDQRAAAALGGRLIHHEIFHFIDYADDGVVRHDQRWEQLNEPSFAGYGHGGRSMRDPASSAVDPTLRGFVTGYSTSAVEEDKAELFAFMMAAPDMVARRAAGDPVIAAKAAYLRRVVAALSPATGELLQQQLASRRSR